MIEKDFSFVMRPSLHPKLEKILSIFDSCSDLEDQKQLWTVIKLYSENVLSAMEDGKKLQ